MALEEEPEEPEEAQEWLATFADLSTLLLCFFVLLYSMSSVDAQKFDATFSSIRDTFGGDNKDHLSMPEESKPADAQSMEEMVRIQEEIIESQRQSYNTIQSFITKEQMENQITAVFDNGKIILTVPGDVLFNPASEFLSANAERALYTLLNIFHQNRDQSINIHGYSDNTPVPRGARFYDNWELSGLRAVNVLRYYLNAGVETHRIVASGMGELNPKFPNDTNEHKAQNLRVEFILEKDARSGR